jgi:hypothetical protein
VQLPPQPTPHTPVAPLRGWHCEHSPVQSLSEEQPPPHAQSQPPQKPVGKQTVHLPGSTDCEQLWLDEQARPQ